MIELFIHEEATVIPGQALCKSVEGLMLGEGVYQDKGLIKSSRLGSLHLTSSKVPSTISAILPTTGQNDLPFNLLSKTLQINLGDVVLAKVLKLTENGIRVRIISSGSKSVGHAFEGTIRKEHIKSDGFDFTSVDEACIPGDILRCRVKSLNESKNIILSIDEGGMGVILAHSLNRNILAPISKDRMQSPTTKKIFKKKVAFLEENEIQLN